MVIARKIIEEARRQGKVKGITVEVGELAHLPIEEFEPLIKSLVGWDVNVVEKPAVVECECGFKGAPNILERGHDSTLFVCPGCEAIPKVLKGGEIKLISVDVE